MCLRVSHPIYTYHLHACDTELCYVTHTSANISTDIKHRAGLLAIAGSCINLSICRYLDSRTVHQSERTCIICTVETCPAFYNIQCILRTCVSAGSFEFPSVRTATTLGTLLRSPVAEVSIVVRTYSSAPAVSVLPPE